MSGSSDGAGAVARFNNPLGVATDGAGHLFVADTGNHTIRQIDVATGTVTTLAGAAGMSGSSDGTGPAARLYFPSSIASDGAGQLFVADWYNDTIRQIEIATGIVTTLAGTTGMSGSNDATGTAARFRSPWGIASDSAGHLFVSDSGNHTIRQIEIATGVVTTLAGSAGTSGNSDGTGTAARFDTPRGVARDGAGHLFIGYTFNHTIRQIAIATGVVTTIAGSAQVSGGSDNTGTAARFNGPWSVASDGAGHLFIADTYNNAIREIVIATGAVTAFAGLVGAPGSGDGTGTAARLWSPTGLASDGVGNLFVADAYKNTIRKIVIATGV
jgi:hypothetical protein